MTTAEKPTRIVLATVKSKAEAEDGWKVELDIPEFGSQFSTICTRVLPDIALLVSIGQTLRVRLERQKLKKNKDGSLKDGAFPSHYYWGLVGFAAKDEAPALEQPGQAQAKPRLDRLDTGASIEAQTAYKVAGAMATALLGAGLLAPEDVEKVLRRWTLAGYRYIREAQHTGAASEPKGQAIADVPPAGSPASVSSAGPEPKDIPIPTTPTTPRPPTDRAGARPQGASPTTKSQMPDPVRFQALCQGMGYNTVGAALKVLAIASFSEIRDVQAALDVLAQSKHLPAPVWEA